MTTLINESFLKVMVPSTVRTIPHDRGATRLGWKTGQLACSARLHVIVPFSL